jgi:arginine exporter protein ArgO
LAAGAALTAALEPIAAPLRIAGGLVLISLAGAGLWHGLRRSGNQSGAVATCSLLKMYAQFVAITIINPLTVVYFAAFILGRGASAVHYPLLANLLFVVGAGLASLSWQTLLAAIGGVAGSRLSARFRLYAVVLGNVLVLGLGSRILVSVALTV